MPDALWAGYINRLVLTSHCNWYTEIMTQHIFLLGTYFFTRKEGNRTNSYILELNQASSMQNLNSIHANSRSSDIDGTFFLTKNHLLTPLSIDGTFFLKTQDLRLTILSSLLICCPVLQTVVFITQRNSFIASCPSLSHTSTT